MGKFTKEVDDGGLLTMTEDSVWSMVPAPRQLAR